MDFATPESFLEVLGMNEEEIRCCNHYSIFTVRQLAFADPHAEYFEFMDQERLHRFIAMGRKVVFSYTPPDPIKEKNDGTMWAYTYVGPAMFEQIERDTVFKSPYILFQEFLECPLEFREAHPWKSVYYSLMKVAGEWIDSGGAAVTDADVFSYLIWKGAQSVLGSFDLTAGPRAIPFLYAWLPGELHGSALEIDKVIARELNNPSLADRYAHPLALNLTKLCEKHDGKLYKVQGLSDNKLENLNLGELPFLASTPALFDRFDPGKDIFESVPHGCVVIPTGVIPVDCVRMYPRKQAVEKLVYLN